jgi:hypothetical protein
MADPIHDPMGFNDKPRTPAPPPDRIKCPKCKRTLPLEWRRNRERSDGALMLAQQPDDHHLHLVFAEHDYNPVDVIVASCRVAPQGADAWQAATEPIVHDSGAKRSEKMPHYASIDGAFMWRLAQVHTGAPRGENRLDHRTGFSYHGGDLGYGRGNWHKGLPMVDTFGHLIKHLYDWKEIIEQGRQPDNDDLAAAVWNIEVLMRFEQQYIVEFRKLREDEASSHAR